MAVVGKFNKPGAGAAARPPVKKKSRYAGIKEGKERDPMPEVGKYRFRIVSVEEAQNPGTMKESVKVHVVPVELVGNEYQEGAQMLCLFMRTTAGLAEFKRCIRTAAGFDEVEAYDAFDPDGEFLDSCVGVQNEYSEAGATVLGRLVDCDVKRGKATGDGDYYRNYHWTVVPEDEQDQAASCNPAAAAGE
jgi:hypothetical protein